MNTGLTSPIVTTNSAATSELAARLGHKLRGGELIELRGDLGSGKTTFVKGLVKGAGSHDTVRSPSFTLSNEYRAGRLTIYHFDFYRLSEPGIMRNEIAEALEEADSVVVIEWADIIDDVLPPEHISITLTATGENERQLNFRCPDKFSYIFSKA